MSKIKVGMRVLLPADEERALPEQRGTVLSAIPSSNTVIVDVDENDRSDEDSDGRTEVLTSDCAVLHEPEVKT